MKKLKGIKYTFSEKTKISAKQNKNFKKFLSAKEKKLTLTKKVFESKIEVAPKSKILLNFIKEKQPIKTPTRSAPLNAIKNVLQNSKCSAKLNKKLFLPLLLFMLNFMFSFVEIC